MNNSNKLTEAEKNQIERSYYWKLIPANSHPLPMKEKISPILKMKVPCPPILQFSKDNY